LEESEVVIMVDCYGKWTEEQDYSKYPEEKWCDYDYMAIWIRKQGYEPETSMENLISNIMLSHDWDDNVVKFGYYALKDERKFPDNMMVYIPDIAEYVRDSGGLSEFDYE
jgi:hypothetical protein